jgi:signal transduction histidine kinase
MAIVAKVVEAHRGKVRIRSQPGAGTTILLILPV